MDIEWVGFDLADLEVAIRITEGALEAEQRDIKERHARLRAEATGPRGVQPGSRFADLLPERYRVDIVLPVIVRRSLFLTMFSLLEHLLVRACTATQERAGLATALPRDRGGGLLERVQKYLKTEGKIAFPDQGASWRTLLGYRDARNAIVHAGGIVKPEILSRISSLPGLKITPSQEIFLATEFCPEAREIIAIFVGELSAAYSERFA